jgi:hypothetical protein
MRKSGVSFEAIPGRLSAIWGKLERKRRGKASAPQKRGERLPEKKSRGDVREEIALKKAILLMTNQSGERQEAAWPTPKQEPWLLIR